MEVNHVKRANAKQAYTRQQCKELAGCANDPLYFMRNFVRVQHPTKGALPFIPYHFQEEMITAYNTHRFNVSLCGRQQGKCSIYDTEITMNDGKTKIGSLVELNLRDRIVSWLERLLVRLYV